MAVADLITLGIGPASDIPHLITFGLDIGEAVADSEPEGRIVRAFGVPRTVVVRAPARNVAVRPWRRNVRVI